MRIVSAGCLVSVALAACSHGPTGPTANLVLAAHFDSLATVENHPPFFQTPLRLEMLEVIANALAHGAVPSLVTMTMAGKPVVVHLVGVEIVDTNEVTFGTVGAAGWVDPDADTAIYITASVADTLVFDTSVNFLVGESEEGGVPSPFTLVEQSTSGSCLNYPIKNEIAGPNPQCHLASATVSFTVLPNNFGAIVSPTVTFGLAQLAASSQGL